MKRIIFKTEETPSSHSALRSSVPAPNSAIVAHANQNVTVPGERRLPNGGRTLGMIQLATPRVHRIVRVQLPNVGPTILITQSQILLPIIQRKPDEPNVALLVLECT